MPSGPSLMVRVLGDTSGLARSFQTTGERAKGAASSAQQAFGGMLATLNRTGVLGPFGEALDTVNEAFGQILEHGAKVSDVMLGAGGALVGVGTAFAVLGSKEKAAHQQLSAAIDATGHSYDQYGKQIDEAIKHEEKYGHSSVQTQNALQALTQATHNPAEALKLLGTATDLAAAKHEDLSSAASQLGKVYNGNAKLLKEYGVVVDKHTHLTKDGQTATEALAKVLSGQAAASADTFSGHMKAITTTIEDQVSVFGEKYGPALQGAGAALTGLGTVMKLGQAAMGAFQTSTEAAAAATDAEAASAVAADAASLPLIATVGLIVLGIAALVAAAYVLYRNWSTVWGFVKRVVMDVWDWIRVNWPLLLGILLGPVALAAALIWKYWSTIEAGIAAVLGWIRAHWALIVDVLLGPVGVAITQIVQHWQGFIGFFAGLPGQIANIAAHMWDSIYGAFKAVINGIIDVWNRLHFTLPKINVGPVHIGGETVGVPQIPHLAQGGLITASGLVYAHAGEAITPIDKAPRSGPAVVIQNAHFATELDVEAFMKRTAWTLKTAGV